MTNVEKKDNHEDLRNLYDNLNRAEMRMENSIREKVKQYLPDYQKGVKVLLEHWNTVDAKFILEEKHLLPVVADAGSPFLFIDLEIGEILTASGPYYDMGFTIADSKEIIKFGASPERIDPLIISGEMMEIDKKKGIWGRRAEWIKEREKVGDYQVGRYELGEELLVWLLMIKLNAFGDLAPRDFDHKIADVLSALGLGFLDHGSGYVVTPSDSDIINTLWLLVHDHVVTVSDGRIKSMI